jgi:hypothetical protein
MALRPPFFAQVPAGQYPDFAEPGPLELHFALCAKAGIALTLSVATTTAIATVFIVHSPCSAGQKFCQELAGVSIFTSPVAFALTTPARSAEATMIDELPFKVVRSNGTDEVLARAMNLLIARGAYREAARMYPDELIELRQGARIIEQSK